MYKDTDNLTGKERQAIADKKYYEAHKEQKLAYNNVYNNAHREHFAELQKAWQQANKSKHNAANRQYRINNPDKVKNSTLKCLYGITLEQWNTMFIKQGGCCAICGVHASQFKKGLVSDHDHLSGKFRGILCNSCNIKLGKSGIGKFDVTDTLYSKALGYITIYNN